MSLLDEANGFVRGEMRLGDFPVLPCMRALTSFCRKFLLAK